MNQLGEPVNLPPTPLEQTAADLIGFLSVNGCSQSPTPQVSDFQTAWNDSGNGGLLKVDGKYGPLTRGALQTVMNIAGKGAAPHDCFSPAPTSPVAPPVSPLVVPPTPLPPLPAPVVVAPTAPASALPYLLIGAGVATAGFFGYAYWKQNLKHKRA
jgi:hypothetical protein